jgi:hypothetical protein
MRSSHTFGTGLVAVGRLAAAAVLALSSAHPAAAAVITKKADPRGIDLITIEGELELKDDAAFVKAAADSSRAIVFLSSPGGRLAPALEIGATVHRKGFSTVAVRDCASACGIIWLAGSSRYVQPRARVGFHRVSTVDLGSSASAGNALVGAYLNTLGLGASVIRYVVDAAPEEMKWLTPADAKTLGLRAEFDDDRDGVIDLFNRAVEVRKKSGTTAEVARLYRESADAGFAGAQNNLGDLYESGKGLAANPVVAAYWYARAAERGEPTAYLSLASLLKRNTTDRTVLVEAFKYALLAAARLEDGRNRQTAVAIVQELEGRLDLDDRLRATELVKAWKPLFQETQLMSDTPF